MYAKFSPEEQAKVAKYASMNGVVAAQRHFSSELKESTVRTWEMKYLKELSQHRKAGAGMGCICGTMDGEFLCPQLIYQGKTKACLQKHQFPSGWHISHTPNHWSNEETMKEYVLKKSTRQKLKP